MHKRLRQADSDMRYLGRAWRAGFYGPRERPAQTTLWQQILQQSRSIPHTFDEERIWTIHAQWLRLADADEYAAVLLKLAYRDGYDFTDKEVNPALDRFSKV